MANISEMYCGYGHGWALFTGNIVYRLLCFILFLFHTCLEGFGLLKFVINLLQRKWLSFKICFSAVMDMFCSPFTNKRVKFYPLFCSCVAWLQATWDCFISFRKEMAANQKLLFYCSYGPVFGCFSLKNRCTVYD